MAAAKLKELRPMSKDELIRKHGNVANSTSVELNYHIKSAITAKSLRKIIDKFT